MIRPIPRIFIITYNKERSVEIDVGRDLVHLYDTVSNRVVRSNVKRMIFFTLEKDSAAVIVITPANGKIEYKNNKILVNGIVVDHHPDISSNFINSGSKKIKLGCEKWNSTENHMLF